MAAAFWSLNDYVSVGCRPAESMKVNVKYIPQLPG
jgi:hypothetical protein